MNPLPAKPLFSMLGAPGAAGTGMAPWVAVSVMAHVALAVVSPVESASVSTGRHAPQTTFFELPPLPDPSEAIAAPPPPPPVRAARSVVAAPRPVPERAVPDTEANPVADRVVPDDAPAVAAATVESSTPGGVEVAAVVSHDAGAGIGAGQRHDAPVVAAGPSSAEIDPAPFRRRYVVSINRLVPEPSVPRSLADEAIDAVTVVGLTIDPQGHVVRIRVARSCGNAAFDAIALGFYERHAFALPAPPDEARWETREIPLPIRWRN